MIEELPILEPASPSIQQQSVLRRIRLHLGLSHLLSVRSIGLAVGAKVFGLAVTFSFHVVISRKLHAGGAGLFYLSLATVTVVLVLTRIGVDVPLMRDTAIAIDSSDVHRLLRNLIEAASMTAVLALLAGLLLATCSGMVCGLIFRKAELSPFLRLLSMSLLPLSLLQTLCSFLKGTGLTAFALLIENPLLLAVALVFTPALVHKYGGSGAAGAYLVGAVAAMTAAAFATTWRLRNLTSRGGFAATGLTGAWQSRDRLLSLFRGAIQHARGCRHFWANDLLLNLIGNLDSLLLGVFTAEQNVGIFNAVLRFSLAPSWFRTPVYNFAAPQMASHWHRRNLHALQAVSVSVARILALCTLPFLAVTILAPKMCLGLFGEEFKAGWIALLIVTFGKLCEVLAGPSRELLLLCNQERSVTIAVLSTVCFQAALLAILVPKWGLTGAALANCLMSVFLAAQTLTWVRKRLSINSCCFAGRA